MKDSDQTKTIASIVLAVLTIVLGYHYVRQNMPNPRPAETKASGAVPAMRDMHRVQSRLWQDPFESFESETNPLVILASNNCAVPFPAWTQASNGCTSFWEELKRHEITDQSDGLTNEQTVILGVMLEGGPYADEEEVRLRTRYAVLMALLAPSDAGPEATVNFRPEDRSHIYTNTMWLTTDENDTNGVASRYAYEWFQCVNRTNSLTRVSRSRICVAWLNEDDFADNPGMRLGSLLGQISPVINRRTNFSFYLIGPRASDTLRALANTVTNNSANCSNLVQAARGGDFQILSPEATACIADNNKNDPYDLIVSNDLEQVLGTNVFHNWIATDQQIATLIANELTNRIDLRQPKVNNVVVLLSEQDTYYGSKLADEWSAALADQVCFGWSNIWQYAYLRGLDGSKPQMAPAQRASATAGAAEGETAAATVQSQQEGQQADGDAQLDYVVRLANFLEEKAGELKEQRGGQIVAFGFTGSDTYDKLMLLEQLQPRFPEAVFFTTDLDARLWTTREIRYTRGMLVGSAYPLDPEIQPDFAQFLEDEVPPFRDVYQTSVYRACCRVTDRLLFPTNDSALDPDVKYLKGGLYVIGRHGPVRLSADNSEAEAVEVARPNPGALAGPLICMTVAAAAWLIFFFASANGGFRRRREEAKEEEKAGRAALPEKVREAEDAEQMRQVSHQMLLTAVGTIALAGAATWLFQYWAATTAAQVWEEPWNFTEGISIWPTEFFRLFTVLMALFFFAAANYRRRKHRQRLWEDFFREDDLPGGKRLIWDTVFTGWLKRWRDPLFNAEKDEIIRQEQAYQATLATDPGQRQTEAELRHDLEQERSAGLITGWIPPFIEVEHDGKPEACVNATALFRGYVHVGRGWCRAARALFITVVYFVLAFVALGSLGDIPTFLFIRGADSHQLDFVMTVASVFAMLFVLFYIMDTALLTKRMLDHLSRHPTHWPDPPLRRNAIKYGLQTRHLDSLLDVEFAAVQTGEIGPLMFAPLLMILALLVSRSTILDSWPWPPGLIAIFLLNFLLVVFSWWMVRRATEHVRRDALERLAAVRSEVEMAGDETYEIMAKRCAKSTEHSGEPTVILEKTVKNTIPVQREQYLKNLDAVIERIKDEKHGAFAAWFQDPAYLAVGIPSGVTGIVSLIVSYLQSR